MSEKIDREGVFRGFVIDHGVSNTSASDLPQLSLKVRATEYLDKESGQWIDWSQYEECEATGYLVLFSKKGDATRNMTQVMKALAWDGASFVELGGMDLSETFIMFRVEENVYNGKTTLRLGWIDHKDANPFGSLQKLDVKGLRDLDAKFKNQLAKLSGGPKPKKVGDAPLPLPKKRAVPPTQAPDPEPTPEPETEETATAPKAKAGKREKPARKTTPPKAPAKTKGEPVGVQELLGLPEAASEGEAWDQIEQHVDPERKENVENKWLEVVEELGGHEAIDDGNNWASVRDIVLETLGVAK